MYFVKPISIETLWGDKRLYAYSGDRQKERIGMVYSLSGIDGLDCVIENEQERTTLNEAVRKDPKRFGLEEGEEYPLIIAFDACSQSVSFQMHPTDRFARDHLHRLYGKSEAWYFLEAPEEGWIYAEDRTGKKEGWKQTIQSGDFRKSIGQIPVQVSDLVYIRSGTVHALTKGSLIYEVQQSTNQTYRLYDYERIDPKTGKDRPLHVEEALENLDVSLKVKKERCMCGSSFSEREFDLQHFHLSKKFVNRHTLAIVISVLSGCLKVKGRRITPGQSLLVLPQETMEIEEGAEVMIAIPHPYWRKVV